MKPIGVHLIGRFGNQMFQYAYARAWAEREGRVLHTNGWAGAKIFELWEPGLVAGMEMLPEHYRQDQESLIYTRKQAREWFRMRPRVAEELASGRWTVDGGRSVVTHMRRGDYFACGYPVVSLKAYLDAMVEWGVNTSPPFFVSEEIPMTHPEFTGDLSFVPDFWTLVKAPVLFRANSSFSWWAATLGNGRVFAPVIEGLTGGMEHDAVRFVEGNWPRLAELPFVTDLRLEEG